MFCGFNARVLDSISVIDSYVVGIANKATMVYLKVKFYPRAQSDRVHIIINDSYYTMTVIIKNKMYY